MHVTLHQLRIFAAVARLGSFSAAARKLHLTQPTLSMQVKQLADQVGLPLFDLVGRRIRLTDAGADLLACAEQVADALAQFEENLGARKGLARGRLRLAVVSTAEYFVPRLLGDFRRLHPGLDVALQVMNRQQVIERMAAHGDDLYVMARPPEDARFAARPFADNPLVVIAPATHRLAGSGRIPLVALAREEFVLREQGSGTRLVAEEFFARHGQRLTARIELGSNEAIKQAVAGGLGLAVLSAHALNAQSRADGLAVLDVKGFPIPAHWYVVQALGRSLPLPAQAFLVYLEEAAPGLAAALAERLPALPAEEREA